MKKIILMLLGIFFLVGCSSTNPPEAPQAKGKWEVIQTSVNDIAKGF